MYKKALRLNDCELASALLITGSNTTTYAAPVAGVTSAMEVGASNATLVAGFSLTYSNYMASSELVAKANVATAQNNDTPVVTEGDAAQQDTAEEAQPAEEDPFANVAIAQVDNYVNIRSEASEDSEVLGKLYNNSAATVQQTVDGWYQITSGTVTGYVKSEYVVVGNEELARSVGRRVATVNEDAVTLFVRTEPSTDSKKLGMVAGLDDMTVTDESVDGWVIVSIEEGEGYVSADYVTISTEFVQAESKEEEAARLAKEEAERKAAEEAAAAAARKASQQQSSAPAASSAPARSYAPPSGGNGAAVASYAGQFVGNPYVYGGTSLTDGADCSGFVMSVYAAFGVSLPHSSAMRGVGYEVSQADMQPGDIVCYSGHVAIYVGNNTIVHASTPESGIKYTSPAAYRSIITVRRIF